MPEPLIRAGRLTDLPAIERIERSVFPTDRLSSRSLRRHLRQDPGALRLAMLGDRPAGYVLVLFRRGSARARLYSLAVAPEAAGNGLGRTLLGEAERIAAAAGCRVLGLEVRADNAAAIALYRSSGYREFGRHFSYYEDQMDALRFEKPLAEAVEAGRVAHEGDGASSAR